MISDLMLSCKVGTWRYPQYLKLCALCLPHSWQFAGSIQKLI